MSAYCSSCNRSFRHQGALEAHNADVHPPLFECEACDRTFYSQQGLDSHNAAKHPYFDCDLCDRTFNSAQGLESHKAAKHPYFDCDLCNRTFDSAQGLDSHKAAKHPSFDCDSCDKTFNSAQSLDSHKAIKHPSFYCNSCDKPFNSAQGLDSHKAAKHPSFYCDSCDKTFNSVQGLDSHIETKHPKFECGYCNRWFTTERGRELHLAAKHTVTCTICDRDFHAQLALNDHYYGSSAHPNCDTCRIGFRDYDELDEHEAVEHPYHPYQVPCLACGGRLFNAAVLEDHYFGSGNHPKCTPCYRGFKDDLQYANHVKFTHPELCCNLCNREFESAQAVAFHYLNFPLHPKCFECNLGFKDEFELIAHNNHLHPTSTTSPASTSTVLPSQSPPYSAFSPSTVLDSSVGNVSVDTLQIDSDEESDGEMDDTTTLSGNTEQETLADNVSVPEEYRGLYDVFVRFATLLRERSKYRKLLHLGMSEAQRVLNFLQLAVDYLALDPLLKGCVLNALLKLSKRYSLYPASFTLQDVEKRGFPRASGNFGDIWEGHIKGKTVCLKVLKVYANSDMQKIFKAFSREAIVWSHVSHVNLLPFYGIHHLTDVDMTRICLVSPWMENGNVIEHLERNPTENRLLIINDIIQGINYLHENQIVHGDLKGVNILVTSTRRACLADFGLSTINDPEIIKWTTGITSTQGTGTIRWQAPELFDAELDYVELNKASDIYAFSCVCYEVLTGQYPFFEIYRDIAVIAKVMGRGRPSHPSTWQITLPLYLDMTVLELMWPLMQQCWSYEPSDRPDAQSIIPQLPMDGIIDTRPNGDWGDFTPSSFRNAVNQTGYDITIDDARELLSFLS